MIRIEINENELWQSDRNCGVCGEANSTELVIAFFEGWQNLSKKVVFYDARGQNPVTVLLTEGVRIVGQSSETYLIRMPAEPLRYEGNIEYAIEGFAESVKKKSVCGKFKVRYAPDTNVEELPEETALSIGEQLQAEADRLGTLGNNIVPKIGDNGNWFVYSQESGAFVDTGISAKGPKGEQGQQGLQGEDGYTPQIGVDYWTEQDQEEMNEYVKERVGETEDAVKKILDIQDALIEGAPLLCLIGAAPADHTHTAEDVGAAPEYTYGTEDLTAGNSNLETGKLYFVYE